MSLSCSGRSSMFFGVRCCRFPPGFWAMLLAFCSDARGFVIGCCLVRSDARGRLDA
jgi:hypothetical protein